MIEKHSEQQILQAFQEQNWPTLIKNPLGNHNLLVEVVAELNKNHVNPHTVRFYIKDGKVGWEIPSAKPNEKTPTAKIRQNAATKT